MTEASGCMAWNAVNTLAEPPLRQALLWQIKTVLVETNGLISVLEGQNLAAFAAPFLL